MKIVVIVVISLLTTAAVAAALIWYNMGKPIYEPGMVRDGENLAAPLTPPDQADKAHFWTVTEGIELYHFAEGRGRNVLVIHGGPGQPYKEPWPGLAGLANGYTFHYYDQRGCGRSTRPIVTLASNNYRANVQAVDRALGLGAQIADIERIRQILGEEQLIIIGHSFGGFLSSLYAAEFPERVEAVILVAPADLLVMPQKNDDLFTAVHQRLPQEMIGEYDAFLADYLNFRDIFSRSDAELAAMNREFGRYYQAAVSTPLLEGGESGGWMVQAQYLSMGRRHDYRAALSAVTAPVLVIHGTEDLQTEAASQVYVEALPQAQFQLIERAGHFAFVEQPEVFGQVVATFLQGRP